MKSESISELVDIANKVCMKFSEKLKKGGVTKRMMEVLHQMKKSLDQMNQISAQQDWQSGTDLKEVDNLIMNDKIDSHLDQKQKTELKIKKEQQQEQQIVLNQENVPLSFSPTQRMARGPYRQYSEQIKENVIELYKQGIKFSKISKIFNIPTKNVIRWCRNGPYRKPGAGRKVLDPQMQEQLYFQIQRNYEIGSQIQVQAIRRKAKQMGKIQGFYASMGWFKNFDKRYGLKKRYKLC